MLTTGILGILLGIVLIAVDFSKIIDVLFIIIGIVILVCNLPAFIYAITSLKIPSIISSALPIAAGVLMIFWHTSVLFYILGIYMIILPVCRIILSRDAASSFKLELPRLILGLLLLIIGPGVAVNMLFTVAGYVLCVLSAVYIVIGVIKSR